MDIRNGDAGQSTAGETHGCRLNPRPKSLESKILPIKKLGIAENLDLNLGKNSIKRIAKAQNVLNLRIDLSRRILPRRVNFKIYGDKI